MIFSAKKYLIVLTSLRFRCVWFITVTTRRTTATAATAAAIALSTFTFPRFL